MDLGLGEDDGNPQQAAPAVRPDPDGREDGCITHDAVDPDLLVAGIHDEIPDPAEGAVAPLFEVVIQQLAGATDLRGG